MLLVFDIGNTKTGIGVYHEGRWKADWRITTHIHYLTDEYAMLLKSLLNEADLAYDHIDGVVLASVVPPLTSVFQELTERYIGRRALVVGHDVNIGVEIRIDNPEETGADRVANTAAVHTLYGGPAIVLDLGTATTFDVVSDKGEYLGGAIAPGLGISAEALVRQTARLPKVELAPPDRVIGRSTVTAMQSGLVFGYVGLVKELIERLKSEMGGSPKVIATGGMAELISEWTHAIDIVNPRLTLDGIRIIYELNQS
jgi:type III pantothenate kinase